MMMPNSLTWIAAFCGFYAATSEASALPRGQSDKGKCRKTKVAVLGAGVTGITTAQALTNASITDFIIVDRNDYIGGRVAHTSFGKKPDGSAYTVELGANWIQGLGAKDAPENPIWRLVKKYSVKNTYSNYSSILTYDRSGSNDYSHLLDKYSNKYETAGAEAGEILYNNLQDTNVRAGLSLAGWKPKKNMLEQAVEWWNWDWETAIPPESCSFEFGVAGSNVTFDIFGDSNNYAWDQRGFNTFIRGEASEFLKPNDPRLMLETTVSTIKYSEEGVTVEFDDGGCIEAEHAVCTFSLGVLQNDVVNFEPTLPSWKRSAIELFQMGTYTKIFFQFNETFWDEDTQYFLYADPDERGYYPVWQSLSAPGFLPGSNIIFVTVVHDQSYQVEQQDEGKTKAEAMAVLREMFPHKDIPEPIDFMYPRWSEEPWAFGSYSNWPAGMTLEKHQNLRANVDRLWFAGESNSAEYFGFLQGGWFEGQEIGMRIASMLGGKPTDVGTYHNYTVSGPLAHYEVLHGTTRLTEYNERNGWPLSSFVEYD